MKFDSNVHLLPVLFAACFALHPLSALARAKSTEEASQFASATDAHAAPCINWLSPLVPARAVLLCIHGLGLNSNAYADFGKHMSRLGIATYAIDVRGFGSWMKAQGHAKLDFNGTLLDIQQALQTIRAANPGLPVFLLGESMGGAIALRACSMYPELIDGLVSSVPAGDRFQQKRTELNVALHFIKGPRKQFDIGDNIVNQATNSDELRQAWECDPLNRMDLSADELIQFQHFMNENHDAVKKIDHTPVLMVQGTMDKLVKPEGTWELFEALPSSQKTFVAMPSEHLVFEEGQAKSSRYDQKAARLVATWIFSCLNADPQTTPRAGYDGQQVGTTVRLQPSELSAIKPGPHGQQLPGQPNGATSSNPLSTTQSAAIALCKEGQYQEALPQLQQLAESQPLDGEVHFWLGTCYKQLHRPKLAWRELLLARSLAQASGQMTEANASLLDIANDTTAGLGTRISTPANAISQGKPTVLVFWAPWCVQCQDLNHLVTQAHRSFGEGVQIKKVDIDDKSNASLVQEFSVGPIPTCVFVKASGQVQSTLVGLSSYPNFAKSIEGILR